MSGLVIVDTGCANISSVYFAFKRLGADATISKDPRAIKAASRIVLPGVGSARQAMQNLQQRELIECLQAVQQPLLGICLGMQLLTAHSMEGDVPCLNLIPGEVLPLQANGLRLPHMGWNTLHSISEHPLMAGFDPQDYVYFVHSFGVAPNRYSLALCDYGNDFSAVIGKGNVAGAQFHPERSGKTGARLLQNFLEWQP
ncbi:imidazole glycerol phosphate synthase subunit HisH [Alkalimonas delamerensis]|uniref:Imidazole glycerol phosphate synthase subunit HisH n=1 Tax=Alkalimonas delamerensis TaxID=265981 RepID=A0ABT9GRP0_9GAMM|nr:imidazole glycerol phosphate synthase subunit HisH [Alkalimonas delamerensis]MDP4529634.1 imidazole glycerol phosphate synthase subunit HisH [Alkalimonas delamerensis]